MRIINVLTIQMGIPVDIQSFLVEDDQLFEGIYDIAIKQGISTVENLITDESLFDEFEFHKNGSFIDKDFEVHIMFSYV